MKRITIYLGLIFIMIMGLSITGCYKDIILPDVAVDPDGPPQAVSYKNDLAPIFNSKCALSGCHIAGAHKPDLPTATSYQSIINGGFVNILVPKESKLYKAVNGSMKEYISSAADRQKVYDWIRNGAPNN